MEKPNLSQRTRTRNLSERASSAGLQAELQAQLSDAEETIIALSNECTNAAAAYKSKLNQLRKEHSTQQQQEPELLAQRDHYRDECRQLRAEIHSLRASSQIELRQLSVDLESLNSKVNLNAHVIEFNLLVMNSLPSHSRVELTSAETNFIRLFYVTKLTEF